MRTSRSGSAPFAGRRRLLAVAAALGPGIVVMLADTDAGSIITAAQSGAQWGYRLLLVQLILIPVLYLVQELTVRLGTVTGRGHGELIRERFGRGWACVSVATLVVACAGAIVSEMAGIVGVGHIWGISTWVSVLAAVVFLAAVVVTGTYRSVERAAIALGAFELVFLVVMVLAKPDPTQMAREAVSLPVSNPAYLYLVAANIGAVVMPWMIFFQQSAVVDKGLSPGQLRSGRIDTATGAVLTQIVMASILIATAATIGETNPGEGLDTAQDISLALTPFLGEVGGQILFSLGMVGASLVAAIVVSLTAAWGLGELTGYPRSLSMKPREAPWFYAVYGGMLLTGAGIVLGGLNLVRLNIAIQVMNALLLPVVLGFLFALSVKALPEKYRLRGPRKWAVGAVGVLTASIGVVAGIYGAAGGGAG